MACTVWRLVGTSEETVRKRYAASRPAKRCVLPSISFLSCWYCAAYCCSCALVTNWSLGRDSSSSQVCLSYVIGFLSVMLSAKTTLKSAALPLCCCVHATTAACRTPAHNKAARAEGDWLTGRLDIGKQTRVVQTGLQHISTNAVYTKFVLIVIAILTRTVLGCRGRHRSKLLMCS